MSMQRTLTNYLTTPHRIASSLDWKKLTSSVLAMNISQDRIGLCLSPHPSSGEAPTQLADIPIKLETHKGKRMLSSEVMKELQDIVQRNKVCGIVVGWPLQHNGRMGAPCGKVLHALDSLVSNSQVLTPNRPFCLWDGAHHEEDRVDAWGRNSSYGEPYHGDVTVPHSAKEEQYVPKENLVAADIWNDFCRIHWPDLQEQRERREEGRFGFSHLVEDYSSEYHHPQEELREAFM